MKKLFIYLLIVFGSIKSYAQLSVNAGVDKTVCPGTTTTIGGSPTISGGTAPFTITWSPATGLSSSTVANPTVSITSSITYTLTVKDSRDSTDTDIVTVFMDDINLMDAGTSQELCLANGQSVTLGSSSNHYTPYRFKWVPSTGLNNDTIPNPTATPTVSTTYTLQIKSPTCGIKTSLVTLNVHTLTISAGPDTTINAGQTVSLEASPFDTAYVYWWGANNGASVMYNSTYNPDVSPNDSTDFILSIKDPWGCIYYDVVRVNVIPSSDLYFYNSITPNGDGENDTWVIKNLEKYPKNKLDIFNRYGQQIYSVHEYKNDWNGKYLGQELPGGTYFYILDTNTDKGKYKGSITIFR